MKKRLFLLFSSALLSSLGLQAQDVRFSQYTKAPLLRNPSLMGLSEGDYEATALYREQWQSIGNAFSTGLLSATLRRPIRISGNSDDYLNFGVTAYTDKAGSLGLRTTGAYAALSLNKNLAGERHSYLSLGFAGGYLLRNFDASQMTVDNQWVNGSFVATAATRENIANPKMQAWDLGAGLTFSTKAGPENQHAVYAGIALYNLTRPRWNFAQSDPPVARPTRISAGGGAVFEVSETYRITADVNYMKQGTANEVIVGATGIWQRRPGRFERGAFHIGTGVYYRHEDALIPLVRLRYNGLTLTTTYDINISPLNAATSLRGGLEMSLTYSGFLDGAKSLADHVSCPVFF